MLGLVATWNVHVLSGCLSVSVCRLQKNDKRSGRDVDDDDDDDPGTASFDETHVRPGSRSISAVASLNMIDAGTTKRDEKFRQWILTWSRNQDGTGRPRKRRLKERIVCLLDFVVMAFWMDYLWSCLPTVGSVDAPNRASCICCRQVAVSPVLALKVGETLSPFSFLARLVVCFRSACVDLYRSLSALFLVRWLLSLRMRWFVLF